MAGEPDRGRGVAQEVHVAVEGLVAETVRGGCGKHATVTRFLSVYCGGGGGGGGGDNGDGGGVVAMMTFMIIVLVCVW